MDAPNGPLWSQEQTIAYEVALEDINDVIAGYSEQIALEQARPSPNTARIAWLEMRTDQAVSVHRSLNVCDDGNVQQAISEFSAIIRARDGENTAQRLALIDVPAAPPHAIADGFDLMVY